MLGLIFAAAAALVWWAGTKIAAYADEIADRTGLGQAAIGVILLGAATSLPEIATTTVATLNDNARMAVNNLLGGVAFQILVLALVDLFVRRGALTVMVPSPRVMLNAGISIILLLIAAIGVMVGDVPIPYLGAGLFSLALGVVYVFAVWQLNKEGATSGWEPTEIFVEPVEEVEADRMPATRLALATLAASLAILVGGTALTLSAEGIAARTGLDTGLMGLTLLAMATSLPELSTSIAAVRLGRAELAIGDVLGGNMFDVALILLVDVLYRQGSALHEVDRASMTMALSGTLMTAIFLIGLIERRNRSLMRIGYDSLAVIVVYVATITAVAMAL
ncbi:sodium:calcium antiporter [Novosphingobium malaysiense]|uniref:Sodium/calcium exchanger membrane region domain-containing protein n=1 Tax=Novosphingobium malaysiense TaxID=1348853 RepID=A0A0B1ZQR8_9SPHN|nr:sodium:calcium antiporter [Novosphingobium malaysiense]KHK92946.1 hypothetical protein LK12_00710 [Novosphingobium malaysiense]